MGERPSEFDREENDWYIEPSWCVDALTRHITLTTAHDPCCGIGTVPDALTRMGIITTGADLVDRAEGRFPVRDFLSDTAGRANIVTNPPFKIAPQIVEHALRHVQPGGYVAAICQAKFLFSQSRHPLFNRPEMDRVLVFSRRPSMPTGEFLKEHGEDGRKGGSIDFIWAIWRAGKTMPGAGVEWVTP